jgi:hypothetical protein
MGFNSGLKGLKNFQCVEDLALYKNHNQYYGKIKYYFIVYYCKKIQPNFIYLLV